MTPTDRFSFHFTKPTTLPLSTKQAIHVVIYRILQEFQLNPWWNLTWGRGKFHLPSALSCAAVFGIISNVWRQKLGSSLHVVNKTTRMTWTGLDWTSTHYTHSLGTGRYWGNRKNLIIKGQLNYSLTMETFGKSEM